MFALPLIRNFLYKAGWYKNLSDPDDVLSRVEKYMDRSSWQESLRSAESFDAQYQKHGVKFIDYYSDDYPDRLREIYDPPLVLFCLGNTEVLNSTVFYAIVGTRKASPVSLFATRLFVERIAGTTQRPGVVSGMALGIDREAMDTALENGMPVVGVLGTAVHKEYPQANKNLYAKMKSNVNACLVSEYLPLDNYGKWTFPMRNRIITGMAIATVLMEAPAKSGGLSSANNAIQQNRDLVVFDHPTLKDNMGGRFLLDDGAIALELSGMGFEGEIVHIADAPEMLAEYKKREMLGTSKHLGGGYYAIF